MCFACKNSSKPIGNSKTDHSQVDTLNEISEQKSGFETNQLSNDEIISIYTLAIKDYIDIVFKKDKIHFDTLYFGKHVYGQADDFPDITLPATINNTQIRLISPEKGIQLQQAHKKMVYINMMGWVDHTNASFILVNFTNGGQHQSDYFIDYTYNDSTKQYLLSSIAMEDYRHLINNKPKRESLYSNGIYKI